MTLTRQYFGALIFFFGKTLTQRETYRLFGQKVVLNIYETSRKKCADIVVRSRRTNLISI